MTINEAIDLVDQLRPNQYERVLKIQWLSKLDGNVFHEVFTTHRGAPVTEFAGYTAETDGNTELLIPFPYAEDIYNYFLQAQIDKENGEITKFNQSIVLYNSAYQAFLNRYHSTHMPISVGGRFRF